MKKQTLVLEVGGKYLLNNGKEVTITAKFAEHPLYYSTPFEEGTLRSAFYTGGINYVDHKIHIVSRVKV
jgi:hypothetical protein